MIYIFPEIGIFNDDDPWLMFSPKVASEVQYHVCVLDTEVTIFPTFTGAGHKSICPGNVVYCVFWRMVEAHHRHIHKIIGFLIISFMTGGSSARRQSGQRRAGRKSVKT